MSLRIHIERLVIDEGALARDQVALFQTALAVELGNLRQPGRDFRPPPIDAPSRLARDVAGAVYDRMPKETAPSGPVSGPPSAGGAA